LKDLLREILQTVGVHLLSVQKKLSEPGFTYRPILGGLQSIKSSDPLIMGHHKDGASLDTFTAACAAIDLNELFNGKF
jgi:hypothetical protein